MRLLDVWKIKNQRLLCFIMALEDKALYCHIKSGAAYWKTLHPRAIPHHHHRHHSLHSISTNTRRSLHRQTTSKDKSNLLPPTPIHEGCDGGRNPFVWGVLLCRLSSNRQMLNYLTNNAWKQTRLSHTLNEECVFLFRMLFKHLALFQPSN